MMNRFEFEPPLEDEVIIVEATISQRYTFRLALDTAATIPHWIVICFS
jgi:hypothetical protein